MYFSANVPFVTVQRELNVSAVAAAREAHPERPSWSALVAKAYAIVAAEFPELRRAYIGLPWPHLYEYKSSVASVVVEHDFSGERGLAFVRVPEPGSVPLAQLSRTIRGAKLDGFIASDRKSRRTVRIARLPLLLRRAFWWVVLNLPRPRANYFGTFGLTTVSAHGTEILNPRSPVATVVTYGPVASDGAVSMRIVFDHRVMDAMTLARAFDRLEQILNGPIADELRSVDGEVVRLDAPSIAPALAQQSAAKARR